MIKRFSKPVNALYTLQNVVDYILLLGRSLDYIFGEIIYLLNKRYTATGTWNPTSIADGAMTSTTVTVTGAAIGDPVAAGFTSITAAGWILSGSVTATDTVTVTLMNLTGSAVDLASGTLSVEVWKL